LSSLDSYPPPHLIRSLARDGEPSCFPRITSFPAALLLSDISGFTALTERLQERGREGAPSASAAWPAGP